MWSKLRALPPYFGGKRRLLWRMFKRQDPEPDARLKWGRIEGRISWPMPLGHRI